MFTEGIFPIGDGLLDIDEDRLKGLLVPHDINEIYEVEQTPFARGKFAAVRRAIHKHTGVHFAAKFLKRRRRAQSSDKEIKHEIAVLMLCDGAEHIVKLNAVHETRADTALLLELATGGELQTLLDNEECLTEAQARICMRQVMKALLFLHKRSIAHLDLKPQNILLAGERIEDGLKLCDFGISRVVAEGTNVREIVGTPDYVAPEVLQYEPLSLLTDIWSVGVLAYVLLSGFSPFGGDTKQETFLNISQCALTFPDKLFDGVSSAAIDFIRRALRIKPNERMSAAGCLEHKWLKDECDIGRQLLNGFGKQSAVATAANDFDIDVHDVDVDEEEEVEEDDENEVIVDHDDDDDDEEEEIDDAAATAAAQAKLNVEQKHEVATTAYNLQHAETAEYQITLNDIDYGNETSTDELINASNKMDSSDTEELDTKTTITNYVRNGYKSSNANTKIPIKNNINTTTVVHTVTGMRSTNIPLQPTKQQQMQQQQLQQFIARRQNASNNSSSDCNKENSYLASKQIASEAVHMCKKSTATVTSTATATATIVIQSAGQQQTAATSNESKQSNTSACLFPDAPTTPKVIRKASTADSSPTSVKALVKKFQLEGKNTKVAQAYAQQHQQQQLQQQQQQQLIHTNGIVQRKSNSFHGKSSTIAGSNNNYNDSSNGKFLKTADRAHNTTSYQQHSERNKSSALNGGIKLHINASGNGSFARRCSEPLTGVHHKKQLSITTTIMPATAPVIAPNSYKSTCVVCLTCGGSNASTGCRHSVRTTVATTLISNGARRASSSSNSNGSSSSCESDSGNVSPTSNGSSSLLLQNMHHQKHSQLPHHHHHHHHHHIGKNGGQNMGQLDQGIIC